MIGKYRAFIQKSNDFSSRVEPDSELADGRQSFALN